MHLGFFSAVKKNDLAKVIRYVKNEGVAIDSRDENTATALMWAVSGNHSELVKWLLANGANPNACDDEGHDVLWCANECNASTEIQHQLVSAIARENKYINTDKPLNKTELLDLLEKKLLLEIASSKAGYPFHDTDYEEIRRLIVTLSPNFFEEKLLRAAITNNETLIIESLRCGADLYQLHHEYLKVRNSSNEIKEGDQARANLLGFLGFLPRIVAAARNYLRVTYNDDSDACGRRALGQSFIDASYLLSKYNYRNTSAYRSNSAVLFLTMLGLESKQAEQSNLSPDTLIIQDEEKRTYHSLKTLSQAILDTVKSNKRTTAFVAFGITRIGQILVTTNYHAPRVYYLEDMLDASRFKNVNSQYTIFMREVGAGVLNYSLGEIHAETMLASLSDQLGIDQILIVDQSGNKKQNCVCCANYLTHQGFSNEPHFERINNFSVPKTKQIEAVATFLNAHPNPAKRFKFCGVKQAKRQKTPHESHRQIFTMLSPEEQEEALIKNDLLQTVVDFVLRYHPNASSVSQKENITAMFGETAKLVNHAHFSFHRDKLKESKLSAKPKRNIKLVLPLDGHVSPSSTMNTQRVAATEPDSPRSNKLARVCNTWLEHGQGTERVRVNRSEPGDELELSRIARAQP